MRGSTYERLLDILGVAAGAAFGLIAVATSWDVIVRSLGGGTLNGLAEIVEYVLFAATFLAAPWLLRQNGHVRVDFLVNAMPSALRHPLRRATDAVGLAVCLTLLAFSALVTYRSWAGHNTVLKTVVFPEWWLYAVIVVSMALLAAEFARRLVVGEDDVVPAPDL